jgi:EAL domain-containing protein (putative c-di-GMP-specific phosphodiesterase class I)
LAPDILLLAISGVSRSTRLKSISRSLRRLDAENYAIVKTIVGLARNLDLKVVAEGVETN